MQRTLLDYIVRRPVAEPEDVAQAYEDFFTSLDVGICSVDVIEDLGFCSVSVVEQPNGGDGGDGGGSAPQESGGFFTSLSTLGLIGAVAVVLVVIIACSIRAVCNRRQKRYMMIHGRRLVLPLPPGCRFHVFVSHAWVRRPQIEHGTFTCLPAHCRLPRR